jgi:hypothetical protein
METGDEVSSQDEENLVPVQRICEDHTSGRRAQKLVLPETSFTSPSLFQHTTSQSVWISHNESVCRFFLLDSTW